MLKNLITRKWPSRLILLSLSCGLLGNSLWAATTSLKVEADAEIRSSASDLNYGLSGGVAMIAWGDNSLWRKAYLRFDASELPQIEAVEALQFTYTSKTPRSAEFFILLREDAESPEWIETTITWDNAPGNQRESGETFDRSGWKLISIGKIFASGIGTPIKMQIEPTAQEALLHALNNGNRQVTLVGRQLLGEHSGSFNFASLEHPTFSPSTLKLRTE